MELFFLWGKVDRFYSKVDKLLAKVDRFSREVDRLLTKVDRFLLILILILRFASTSKKNTNYSSYFW